jgi:hypothetical protein
MDAARTLNLLDRRTDQVSTAQPAGPGNRISSPGPPSSGLAAQLAGDELKTNQIKLSDAMT